MNSDPTLPNDWRRKHQLELPVWVRKIRFHSDNVSDLVETITTYKWELPLVALQNSNTIPDL
jgi:hypothetical protein